MKLAAASLLPLIPLALVFAAPAAAVDVEGTTSLTFDSRVLADLGIEIVSPRTSAVAPRSGGLAFRVEPGSTLEFPTWSDDFEGFDAGTLSHEGGFGLRVGGRVIRFDGVDVSAARAPDELAIADRRGEVWLATRSSHARLDSAAGELRLANADLVLAPALARRIGRPELAGTYLGVLDAQYRFASTAPGVITQGMTCTPNIGPPVDVVLTGLDSMTQQAREAGGRVAMAPRAILTNDGPGDVEWGYAILPDGQPGGTVGPHPFLALAFYRLEGSVLTQIGRADVKHAFFSINTGCACAGDNVLFVGCNDVYGVFTNLDRTYLAPRDEVDAFTRSWTAADSHFDAGGGEMPPERDHFETDHDAFEHRLVVQEPDLQTPGARYFMEAWYLAAGDSNLTNSLGHREVAPSLAGSTWSFAHVDDLVLGSILDEVVPPGGGPGQDNRWLDTGEGRLQLVVDTEDLSPAPETRYTYTLMNFDFERQISSFSVPLEVGQSVSNLEFRDSDDDPANDWTAAVGGQAITWTAPPGGELDWGGAFGFGFDCEADPVSTHAQLEVSEPGSPGTLTVASLGPAVPPIPALGPAGWLLGTAGLGGIAWLWLRRRASGT